MVWVRLADDFTDHPKVVAAGPLAGWLYVCGLTYSNRYLTDGFVPAGQVRRMADVDDAMGLAERLVKVGLWEIVEGGYQIHDYHGYQPSAEDVKRERTMRETRKELYADPVITKFVKNRDADRCRYCGSLVKWNDRKGRLGGTLDHVVPNGGNAVDNIVVACRACNSSKGQRTPEQAGMALLPPGTSTVGARSDLDPTQLESVHPYPARPVPGPGNPAPAGTTPQPPPLAEGEHPPTPRKRGARKSRGERTNGTAHDEPSAEPLEEPVLAPVSAGDRDVWNLARAAASAGLSNGNAETLGLLEPIGRAPDGGLHLRAPPGLGLGKFTNHVARALLDAGDAAGPRVVIVEGRPGESKG